HHERRVLAGAVAVVHCDGCPRPHNGDRHGRRVAPQDAVGRPVGEGVGAAEARRGSVGEGAVAVQGERPVRGASYEHGRQRVAVGVGVIGKHAGHLAGGRAERRVFLGAVVVVPRGGRVVDRRDGDGHGGGGAEGGAVAGVVGEGVGAVEVGGGGVGEGAVGVDGGGAVRRGGHRRRRNAERVAVGVAVVAEHAGRGNRQRRVLGRGVVVVPRGGRIVDRRDGD